MQSNYQQLHHQLIVVYYSGPTCVSALEVHAIAQLLADAYTKGVQIKVAFKKDIPRNGALLHGLI